MGKNKEKLKAMIRELGDAISENLIQSNMVQDVLQRIKEQGYQVDLSLAVGVCLYRQEEEDSLSASYYLAEEESSYRSEEEDDEQKFEFKINRTDLEFLNSLGLRFDS
ncbi:MAG: hypothetical protein K6U11_00895 [bacterium]|nr:hypothetical protein [bacterium]